MTLRPNAIIDYQDEQVAVIRHDARTLGRFGISNDLSESYNRLAIWRITQSGHFTKTEQKAWADRQGQLL